MIPYNGATVIEVQRWLNNAMQTLFVNIIKNVTYCLLQRFIDSAHFQRRCIIKSTFNVWLPNSGQRCTQQRSVTYSPGCDFFMSVGPKGVSEGFQRPSRGSDAVSGGITGYPRERPCGPRGALGVSGGSRVVPESVRGYRRFRSKRVSKGYLEVSAVFRGV